MSNPSQPAQQLASLEEDAIAAECAVLAPFLAGYLPAEKLSTMVDDLSTMLSEESFLLPLHASLWSAIKDAVQVRGAEHLDFVILHGMLGKPCPYSLAEISAIVERSPLSTDVLSHAKRVRDAWARRKLFAVGREIASIAASSGTGAQALESVDSLVTETLERLRASLDDMTASGYRTAVDCIAAMLCNARSMVESAANGGTPNVPCTGIRALDEAMGGFYPGRLYVIAARPGVGKTALLQHFALHSSTMGLPGIIFSLEMSELQLGARTASWLLHDDPRIDVTRLIRGQSPSYEAVLNSDVLELAQRSCGRLYVDTETYDLDAIIARARHAVSRMGAKWIAVDHVGLVRGVTAETRDIEIGRVTWGLKSLAKRAGVPVIALSQLSRRSEYESREPQLSDLRSSGNIEQDADLVILLHRRKDSKDTRKIGLFKHRDGVEGWLPQEFLFDGQRQRWL